LNQLNSNIRITVIEMSFTHSADLLLLTNENTDGLNTLIAFTGLPLPALTRLLTYMLAPYSPYL